MWELGLFWFGQASGTKKFEGFDIDMRSSCIHWWLDHHPQSPETNGMRLTDDLLEQKSPILWQIGDNDSGRQQIKTWLGFTALNSLRDSLKPSNKAEKEIDYGGNYQREQNAAFSHCFKSIVHWCHKSVKLLVQPQTISTQLLDKTLRFLTIWWTNWLFWFLISLVMTSASV